MGLRPEDARHFLRAIQLREDGAVLCERFDRDFPTGRARFVILQLAHASRLPGLRIGDIIEAEIAYGNALRPSRLRPINVDERDYSIKRGPTRNRRAA